jgi:hypothetical protein
VLGNVTVLDARSITISIPPGGLPPTQLILRPIRNVSLRWLKGHREMPVTVYTDRTTQLEFILSRSGTMITDRVRQIPAGSTHITIYVPAMERRRGKYTLIVRATNANLQTHKSFRVK